MKNLNYPLLIGVMILMLLMTAALFPGIFTDHDPLYEYSPGNIAYRDKGEEVEVFAFNPKPPNKDNIMGTDDAGRDVYTRLVYGTRNTMKLVFLIALYRMLIALPLGMMAGMGIKPLSSFVKIFNTLFTAIPILLFSYVVFNYNYFNNLQIDKSITVFSIVLALLGWAKLAAMIEDSVKRVIEEDFIEGEIAIGKSNLQIARQNVFPHLIPHCISLFFKEMAMAMFLIAQLAILTVFVGITRIPKGLSFKASYLMSLEPEWGGTLARIAADIGKTEVTYWLTLYPVLAFALGIIGISLTGEGLKIEFERRESRFISSIRKFYYLVSPRLYIAQVKEIKKHFKAVTAKTLTASLLAAVFLIPWNPSLYKFDLSNADIHIQELSHYKYGGRVAGSEGGHLAGDYIINTLETYGLKVDTMEIKMEIDEKSGYQQFTPMAVESGWLRVYDKEGGQRLYHLHKDYALLTLNEGLLLDKDNDNLLYRGRATGQASSTAKAEGMEVFSISDGGLHYRLQMRLLGSTPSMVLSKRFNLKFIMIDGFNRRTNTYITDSTTIIPFEELRKDLEAGVTEIEMSLTYPQLPHHPARIIYTIIPGKDGSYEEPGEMIIVGAPYDGIHGYGIDESNGMSVAPAATLLEVARALSQINEPLNKSVKLIFFDNEADPIVTTPINGVYHYNSKGKLPIKYANDGGYYYFDLAYPTMVEENFINIISTPAQIRGAKNYLMTLEMEKRLKRLNMKYNRFRYAPWTSNGMHQLNINALSSVALGSPTPVGFYTNKDNLNSLDYKKIKAMGQLILDTLTMNPYVMD